MRNVKWIVLTAILAIVSCKKDGDVDPPELGYDYYPDEIGRYVIYEVDSTTYDDFFRPPLITRRKLMIKERIESYFTDNQGRQAARVEVSEYDSLEAAWIVRKAHYFVKTPKAVERVEDNLRYIKFIFPPSLNSKWKGNKYIQAVDNVAYLDNWEYTVTESRVPTTVNGVTYPSSVSILLRDRETQIQKVYAKEIYAQGVGMIFREWTVLDAQSNFDLPWPERAEKGTIVTMQAVSYGIE
jgi:hypothetical protein